MREATMASTISPLAGGLGGAIREAKPKRCMATCTVWTPPCAREAVTSKPLVTGPHCLPCSTARMASICAIDRLRPLFAAEGGIRDELLRLRAMAHTVLNGAPLTYVPSGTDLLEAAFELIDEFESVAQFIEAAQAIVQPLANLVPVSDRK